MEMEFIIEKGKASDLDELSALYDAVNEYLEGHGNKSGWKKGFYPVREDAAAGVAEGRLYVLRTAGRIAGTVIIRHQHVAGYADYDWGIDLKNDEIFVADTLAVHPNFMKSGVARRLMEFLIAFAKESGMKAARLDVNKRNTPAQGLYESLGFQRIATVDLGYGAPGEACSCLYQLVLPESGR